MELNNLIEFESSPEIKEKLAAYRFLRIPLSVFFKTNVGTPAK
ncbi:MAG TPA: hypothetical protein VFF35_12885 [Bacteroidia bacterium]|nr:hypothetical protein [Bacteroidia bacterium]